MKNERKDIRGVTMTLTGGRLLLPNANIAEIITFAEPEPVPGAPAWILGRLRWRGWRLPLISFAKLAGFAAHEGELPPGALMRVLLRDEYSYIPDLLDIERRLVEELQLAA
jgi:chemosensory pili system protein ChpC